MSFQVPPAAPARTDTVMVESTARPTPRPARVSFRDVVAAGANGLVRGAEIAMHALPGSPMTAAAVRGGGGNGSGATPMVSVGGARVTAAAEGPGATGVGGVGVGGVGTGGAGGVGVGGGTAGGTGGIEGSLAQAQEMNLYYLQIQEQVNAQNRTFTTLSNVLKAEHDTVKTAIGNIR